MINAKEIKNIIEFNEQIEELKKTDTLVKTNISAKEALNRRIYANSLLDVLEEIERNLVKTVKANSRTLPEKMNKEYYKFVYTDLRALRYSVKKLIKAETEYELMGD